MAQSVVTLTELARLYREASTPAEVASVLEARGLDTEALMVRSVAHMKREMAFNTIMLVADERATEANRSSGRAIAQKIENLRRRERALRWAAQALLRAQTTEAPRVSPSAEVMARVNALASEGPTAATLALARRVCLNDAKATDDLDEKRHLVDESERLRARLEGRT